MCGLRCIHVFLFPVTLSHETKNWKSLNHEISHDQKYWTHEIPRRKNFGPNSYPQKEVLDPRNTQEKNFEPTSYPRGKLLDPQNTNEKKLDGTMARWHNGTRPKGPAMARDPQNLAHPF